MKGIPTHLRLKVFNSLQMVVLIEDAPQGENMNVNDFKDVIRKILIETLNRAKRDYVLIGDYDSEIVGVTKIVKRGTHGLDPSVLATCNTGLINSLAAVYANLAPRNLPDFRIQLPGLFLLEEARLIHRAFELITDAAQVAVCSQRMGSMTRMLSDHDGINYTVPEREVGEQFLAMADGSEAPVWGIPGLAPTLTRAAIEITMPLFGINTPNPSNDMSGLRSSTNRMDHSQNFISLEMTPELGTEVSCILAAIMYPGQVEILIRSETAEIAESPIDQLGAFFAKFFL